MEAFSLLKYWRGGGVVNVESGTNVRATTAGTTTIVTTVNRHTADTDEDDDDDDGPFFDLEFTVPDEDGGDEQVKPEDDCSNSADNGDEDRDDDDDIEGDGTDDENERDFKFTLSSGSSGDRTDPNVSLSPSDDLFFKGRLVPIEPSSISFNGSEPNSKSQFPVSLLKSATKFRVLMLKFKKSRANIAEKTEPNGSASATPKQQKQNVDSQNQQQNQPQSKFFTVKFKVEEAPIVSLFTRDNSSRATTTGNKAQKQNSDESSSDEKRFSKDVMQRYLKMVKPLYVRASRRYGDKLGFSGQLNLGSSGGTKARPSPPSTAAEKSPPAAKSTAAKSESESPDVQETSPPGNVKSQKQVNLPAGLRVVCKHLGKSRSASSAVAAAPAVVNPSSRRDDSLLQQQDGIQSAILHCKRSFNASRDSEGSILPRSVSDKLSTYSSSEGGKETCI
uniref:Putative membrane-associated kinase regulator 2 n=1 Tax=Davidia involucrata TaxID=16924 RepID=A0A5B7C8T2_DAVIN